MNIETNASSSKKRSHGEVSSSSSIGSPPHKAGRLDKVDLGLTDEEHHRLDQKVLADFVIRGSKEEDAINDDFVSYLLTVIVVEAPGLLDQTYGLRPNAQTLIKRNDGLSEKLKKAWKNRSFHKIRSLSILQQMVTAHSSSGSVLALAIPKEEQFLASARSWQAPYTHGSATAFLETINKRFVNPNANGIYSNHVAVVQSSGTGKSRMLHEVTSQVFGVIFNFAKDDAGAFPEPDANVRDYFIKHEDQTEVRERAACFFISLFDLLCLKSFKDPAQLQEFLGYGIPEKEKGRSKFFDEVLKRASKMTSIPPTPRLNVSPVFRFRLEQDNPRSLVDAARQLYQTLPARPVGSHKIKFILGFDEASDMADDTGLWDAFTEIRRVLRSIRTFPIYSVFMSTTGSTRQFHPRLEKDKSTRVQTGKLCTWPPYTLVGYDQMAEPLKTGCTLNDATRMEFLIGLGRPLWKTRYGSGTPKVQEGIVHFAREKLLNGQDNATMERKIAPLAVRLPLAFNALTERGREAEHFQVESHMRICLNIVPEADAMYSVAPSEPMLNEAAAQIMGSREAGNPGDSVRVIQQFLSDRYLSKGDRGEMASMLLLLLARDRTCNLPTQSTETRLAMPYHKPVRVTDFLTTLFAKDHHKTILGSQGSFEGPTLEATFTDSWMHFTHFIKVTDYKVVNCRFLMRAMARGAALLCADNQLGADVLVPFCFKGKTMVLENIGGMIFQFKNLPFLNKPLKSILAKMDPRKIGVFDQGSKHHPPSIKIVFSVGTKKPGLRCRIFGVRHSSRVAKTTPHVPQFEIFAAGLSHETFGPIEENQESTWCELVSRSDVEDIYALEDRADVLPVLRRMTPCAQDHKDHWTAFFALQDEASSEYVYDSPSSEDET